MSFEITTTQSEHVTTEGDEALNAEPQYLLVYRISYHGGGIGMGPGESHDFSDDPEWALSIGGLLVWLNNGWMPDNKNTIATIRCQRLYPGGHIIITNPKV